jgi:chromosome segregation ATPase
LNGLGSEKTQLADILEEARSNQSRILKELEEAKQQVERGERKISELNANYVACEEALGAAKDDVNKLSSVLKSYKEDLDKKSELNSLLDAEVTRLENRLEELTAEKSDITESLNLCKDHLEKSSEVNSIMATKVAKLEAVVEDQVLELQAAKLSEADVESSLAESVKTNEELVQKLEGAKHEVQVLTEKLRDECREKKAKIESLNEATLLLNDFERYVFLHGLKRTSILIFCSLYTHHCSHII